MCRESRERRTCATCDWEWQIQKLPCFAAVHGIAFTPWHTICTTLPGIDNQLARCQLRNRRFTKVPGVARSLIQPNKSSIDHYHLDRGIHVYGPINLLNVNLSIVLYGAIFLHCALQRMKLLYYNLDISI